MGYHDQFTEYDHGLLMEHQRTDEQMKPFWRADTDDYEQYYSNDIYANMFENAMCFEDTDCPNGQVCHVTNPVRRATKCFAIDHINDQHAQLHGTEEKKHTERGHFEIGYWCLKDTDCESRHCAQVGPRKYDKECQGPDFVDHELLPKKKRTHPLREPLDSKKKDSDSGAKDEGKKARSAEQPKKKPEESSKNRVPGGSWDDNYIQNF